MMRGFTLLELLVAMAVFAIMSALAYGGLRSVLDARQQLEAHSARLTQLQTSLRQLRDDLAQALPRKLSQRPQQDDGADGAFFGQSDEQKAEIRLSRGGWSNPAGLARSSLQRVHWQFQQGELSRYHGSLLEHPTERPLQKRIQLRQLDGLELRFLDHQGEWHEQWPLPGQTDSQTLPRALEIRLRLRDWGDLTRLFEVGA
ncbi:MAG: type II secretion system minor pseudopilin GspJ [Gammaproteobacteria bacterium SHHR-1]